ncbi:aminomethyl-transferring glycine dehydrogenase [Synechococcus sp. CBW1004]|nr:aminomethyl-transferring glycine dehydrogenase [Synechococcus sp. CBW1004]
MSALFPIRHLGPDQADREQMLAELGLESLEALSAAVVPADILLPAEQAVSGLPQSCSEDDALEELASIAAANRPGRALIGLGYHDTVTPALIQRHVLENPCWYTAYTPYQAEIAQGRLEALLNFQTLISELTGLPIANASLLDEGTAAAEAMALARAVCRRGATRTFLVDREVLPQTLAVLQTRAEPLGLMLSPIDAEALAAALAAGASPEDVLPADAFGLLLQLPGTAGRLWDPAPLLAACQATGVISTAAIDPLAQVLLAPVGHLGVDIAVGSLQRYGVPLGFGGPHAAFFATREDYRRQIPGRLVGVSRDAEGNEALRLALQTREQHIRRDKATSNICTAQVLLAVMAGFYAVHHGPEGLEAIAGRILQLRQALAAALAAGGLAVDPGPGFDTVVVRSARARELVARADAADLLLRHGVRGEGASEALAISLDERSGPAELETLVRLLLADTAPAGLDAAIAVLRDALKNSAAQPRTLAAQAWGALPQRREPWLRQEVFHRHRSETELLRYIQRLASKDLSLVHGMIPLGSCTMKLNAACELAPVSWPAFSRLHPFAPAERCSGYGRLAADLEAWLAALTGFTGVSLQPNAGSQGEYAGLLAIRAWHRSRGEGHRTVCLIPTSAHGTNPASAVMAGLQVVPVACDDQGNIDLSDLEARAREHAGRLAALMVTYPSTHGVFEPQIRRICDLVHAQGGQVYLDGANLNAQVGLCKPGLYGADVCHLNLHKTFCIPHGGGGPGVGPIAVAEHLVPFLPGHPLASAAADGDPPVGPVSAAPLGSAGILPISWMYIRLMGGPGLRLASQTALLAANVIARRLEPHYPVLYRGAGGWVAHECILDLRPLKRSCGLEVDDLAKRLMDYGFHAPTVSWPVAGTVMVEPTESESLAEIDRFCAAMEGIRSEARAIEEGRCDALDNPLKRAPHTLAAVTADAWERPYSRSEAAYPAGESQRSDKFWPAVARIDNAYGDRHLVCTCPSVEELATAMPVAEVAA